MIIVHVLLIHINILSIFVNFLVSASSVGGEFHSPIFYCVKKHFFLSVLNLPSFHLIRCPLVLVL